MLFENKNKKIENESGYVS
jgi:hypothetical protein